jgi:hypothetical protein
LGYRGLISVKSQKEILPAIYDKLSIQAYVIKAWANGRLHVIELDPDHSIKNKIILDNAVTIYQKGNSVLSRSHSTFDSRLLSIGWVYDTVSVFDNKNNWKNTRYIWGIKNEKDSLIQKKTLQTPLYIDKADFSLVPIGKSKLNYMNINCNNQNNKDNNLYNTFNIINYKTGKKNQMYSIFDFDSLDFQHYSFARFSHQNGYGIINSNGDIMSVSYVEANDCDYIRYCISNGYEFAKPNDKEAVQINNRLLKPNRYLYYCQSNVKFKEGSWNFLNKEGDSLFTEPFQFAQNFYKKTAIVKGKKGWGVVSKDSIIIPMIYTSVDRLAFFSDTIFKVQVQHKSSIYLDSNLNIFPLSGVVFEQNTNDISLFTFSGKYKIIGAENQNIIEGVKKKKRPIRLLT